MSDYSIFDKIDNNTRRIHFYEYQKQRGSKIQYGRFLSDYETFLKYQNKMLRHQSRMVEKFGCFNLFLAEQYNEVV